MLEDRMRKILNDIIDVAFSDKSVNERRQYKAFKFRISQSEKKTIGGSYYPKEKLVEVNNPSLGAKHIAKCCLHELSHHIDCCQNGVSGHQKPFYAIYTRLIYASLDMGILEKEDFKDLWARDGKKVWSIIENYAPRPVYYEMPSTPYVCVYNAYSVKNALKESGYRYNKLEQTWEKETDDASKEELFLSTLKVKSIKDSTLPYYVIKTPGMKIDAKIYIEATGDTYSVKDTLKKYGFFYKKEEKKWLAKVNASEKDAFLKELQDNRELNKLKFEVISKKGKKK